MVRVEVRDENMGNILRTNIKSRKLIHNQVFFVQCDGGHPAIKAVWEFFCLIEEAIGIARVKKHWTKTRMLKQRKHGGEMNTAPASAVNGNVFGCGAITSVENVDFHKKQKDLTGFMIRKADRDSGESESIWPITVAWKPVT